MIPSVSANTNVGGSNTPPRQIAWFTCGATGVTVLGQLGVLGNLEGAVKKAG